MILDQDGLFRRRDPYILPHALDEKDLVDIDLYTLLAYVEINMLPFPRQNPRVTSMQAIRLIHLAHGLQEPVEPDRL
jgi:hypothetical protein